MTFLQHSIQAQASLLDILNERARSQPNAQAYVFLENGETESGHLTYQELATQAKAIASHLAPWRGERALLLYPSGLAFITAFLGCLYAGVIAVPVYPPKRNQKLSRLLAIADNAQAELALTTEALLGDIQQRFAQAKPFQDLTFLATDTLEQAPQGFKPQEIQGDDLAFLQYTSGSTGTPKGVMVSHRNILHNQRLIQTAFGHSEKSIGVGWLPLFHDMGLIGHVLQPLYVGFPSILMPPVAFLTNPRRWLQAIAKYRATTSGGPNFAYDLCVDRLTDSDLADLDLSSWNLAYSGAEPVRAATLEKFNQKFAPCGFRPEAFYPCYGMAEATLFITGGDKQQAPITTSSSEESDNLFVSCGQPYHDTQVAIVDPESFAPCPEGTTGEVWVRGDSVAQGYWNAPIATQETFTATLNHHQKSFLRTGDLGFIAAGELFITGRLKDLIIVRGKNHYPHDIELTAQQSHPALRENCGAAFTVEIDGTERLMLVQEVKRTFLRNLDVEAIAQKIRQAIAANHELQTYGIILIKTGSIPKTSSGKIQRHRCRQAFLADELMVVGRSVLGEVDHASAQSFNPPQKQPPSQPTTDLIKPLREQLAQALSLPLDTIQDDQPIAALGLDSVQVVEIKHYIEQKFDLIVPLEKFFEDLTVAQLAQDILTLANLPQESQHHQNGHFPQATQLEAEGIDLDQRLRLAYKPSRNVLDKAREFNLPDQLRANDLLPYFRALERNEGATCIFEGRQLIMLGSNNYLGLTADVRVREATAKAALEEGPSLTGSRLLNGSTRQHREFERKLAAFVGHEDALVFTTGYQANLGFISALMNENTTMILDSEAHACIYDGAFMSRCRVVQYQHNDLQDLEQKLIQVTPESATMVTIDGLYSMTGDIAPLPEIRQLCDRHGATLAVDDAHALGVLGKTGRGTEEHFGMIGSSDILCGTFSKSLASIGGWVAAEAKVIDWIRFNGRSMLFSASIPPTSLAAAATALDILIAEPWRVQKLHENAQYWQRGLQSLGFTVGTAQTPIITVHIGDDFKCMQFCKTLLEAGVYVNAAVYPAVPRNKAALRTSVMATHTQEHLDKALAIFAEVGQQFLAEIEAE
ncbi:aminotransferase class I/II-fold pyridoxal phosphate-dependent enzyme [Picosynechococcus sp. PCC 11901]|uniref:aminotransferase class I/II-fold pyridoxal phosphate-dependent enzyme n=1 Tax=Picosynechococcus sp. PCC 11901 TaxID=2579791 RepID=UPI002103A7D4|nr:aminotransferase class I/II-fold pyridoxal phosphate-dependent enzyme [Picosynechococcus sp. PCC 11901]